MKNTTPIYAGVGSRKTPADVLALMTDVARLLAQDGWQLRTGGAVGADQAFENGCLSAGLTPTPSEVWVPWAGYNGYPGYVLTDSAAANADAIAASLHPAWYRCGRGARRLHGRNAAIVLGGGVGTVDETPADAVICWTRTGGPDGGTGMAMRIAEKRGIPVLNLHRARTAEEVLAEAADAVGGGR